jgi:purine catabolism regulator
VLRLLMTVADTPDLASYVEDELGPLLKHDAGTANPLLPTLRAFLQCDSGKSEAAKKLYVQRRCTTGSNASGACSDGHSTSQRLGTDS